MLSYFSFPTRIVFGPGAIGALGGVVQEFTIRRPLVVTDRGVAQAGLLDRVVAGLEASGAVCAVFDGVDPNPTEENVAAGISRYREHGCDGIVAVGGGSPLDAGKAIRLKTTHDRPLAEYDDFKDGARWVRPDLPPMIAIPTTAGTGSEVGRSAVIVLKETDRKTVIFSPYLMPTVAVCDPELTRRLPKGLTAATGADALTHNIEAYLATGYHPLCDGIALHGTALASRYLPRAVASGEDDLEARTQMMMAAIMGATAFQKGLGATHSLAHPLSSVAGLHHGLANAILLPHVLRFNAEVAADRLRDLAAAMAIDVSGRSPQEAAADAIHAIQSLFRGIGIPVRLSEAGVTAAIIPALVAKAMQDGCHLSNPRPCSAKDFQSLYEAAL
ncbi:MAG: iron-containing alcohol dehydrogenase [Candidatus Latescibacteria bacterium]|nr:iron-containing alcohol dehydrogenase [Candidatus Latescibacterota bacterium]